jgi:signal peptidase II
LPLSLYGTYGGQALDPSDTHPTDPSSRPATATPAGRRRAALIAFVLIGCTVAAADQLLKRWIVTHFSTADAPSEVVGNWLRIHYIHNPGGLFGLFQGSAMAFAVVTVLVVAVLVSLEIGSGWRSWLVTLTLGLLLGGAVGNFIDRIRHGYVIDFADIGVGNSRFYVFNIADSAVTVAIILLFVLWFIAPHLGVSVPDEKDGDAGATDDDAGRVRVR